MATIDLTLSDDDAAPPAPARRAAPPKRPIGQIDLTAESDDEPPARRARAAPAPARAPVEAPWKNKRGAARMFAEFSELNKWSGSPRVYDVSMVDDRVDMWRFRVKDFDRGTKAGRDLNSDLNALSRLRGGFDHIRMEVSFPQDYPNRPFFLRCIAPRFVWYTGHVTAGGAICIEALTTTGGPGAWRPTHSVETILHTVFANMVDCEVQTIRTATGPGGRTGPLRVDLKRKHNPDPLREYSKHEATSAFDRMLSHHQTNGW